MYNTKVSKENKKKIKALVVIDGHLIVTPDGKIWSQRIYDYNFFKRYLDVFDSIRVVSRIKESDNNDNYPNLCSGDNVEFFGIDDFRGPKQYITKYFTINSKIKRAFSNCDCAIFRIPSTTGYLFMNKFKKNKLPYSIEVVVDPWDSFSNDKAFYIQIIRRIWTKRLKKACLQANGVSYVTKNALQNRYPSFAKTYGEDENHFESYYSSVKLSKEYFKNSVEYKEKNSELKIIHVSNMIANSTKGHKEIIEAVSILHNKGINIKVEFVGQGDKIDFFKEYANKLNVEDKIKFIGALSSSDEVRDALMKADMFVFPSHAEGLPRVLIEAMAVGLPCLSTNINGIPELLDSEYLVEVGDSKTLAHKIERFINDEKLREVEGKRNIKIAMEYMDDKLQLRRNEFYKKLYQLAIKSKKKEEKNE